MIGKTRNPFLKFRMSLQIGTDQFLQDLVPFQPADQAPCGVVARDVGRIPGNDVAHQLRDRIIALGLQRFIDIHQDVVRLVSGPHDRVHLHGVELFFHAGPPSVFHSSYYTASSL